MTSNLVPVVALLAWAALACSGKEAQVPAKEPPPAPAAKPATQAAPPPRPALDPIKPSIDLATPPAGAVKLPSGMIFHRLTTTDGPTPGKNDTIEVHFTGWKVATGETFNTTRAQPKPMPLDLSSAGAGFAEVFTQVRVGERIMMWMPAELVAKNGQGTAEALAFEAELLSITPAPPTPADVAAPPASARTARSGARILALSPGAGADKVRPFDTVTFHYVAWSSDGKLLAATKRRGRPVSSPLYRQPRALEDALVGLTVGQRVRFWIDAAKLENLAELVRVPGELPKGLLCFEVELAELTKGTAPPPVPRDVKAPPPGTKKTASGVAYRVLRPGKGTQHPKPTDNVRVHYTGWTTDGRMFDSSVVGGAPASFSLSGVIRGWTEGIPTMVPGELTRLWIPEELAYKGSPGQPQGMLVFDVELLEIFPDPAGGGAPHGENPHAGHGH